MSGTGDLGAADAADAAEPSPSVWPPAWPQPGGVSWPAAGEVHLWWLDLRKAAWPHEELWPWLDAEEQARAARFRRDVLRLRHVAAHGQMRALLAAYLGAAPAALRFEFEANGKPRLRPPAEPSDSVDRAPASPHSLAFNLSHSGDQGLVAIAGDAVAVGADIEMLRPMNDVEDLARRYFTAREATALQSLPASQRHEAFLAAWTRKEAYLKALGAGLSLDTTTFEVTLLPDEPPMLRSIDGNETIAAEWTLWSGRPTSASIAAVAVHHRFASVRCFTLQPPALRD